MCRHPAFYYPQYTMKRQIITLLVVLIVSLSHTWAGKKDTPDFRYPETVATNALSQIRQATDKGDDTGLIDGLIRLTLAKSAISADYMPQLIRLVENKVDSMTDIRPRSILRLFLAEMYYSVYIHDSQQYNNRTEIIGNPPDDITEWCRQDFVDKIACLSDSIIACAPDLASSPVTDFSLLFTIPEDGREFAPTLFDALAYDMLDVLAKLSNSNTIPMRAMTPAGKFLADDFSSMNSKAEKTALQIFAALLRSHRNETEPFAYAEMMRLAYVNIYKTPKNPASTVYREQLYDLYDRYSSQPVSVVILNRIIDEGLYVDVPDEQIQAARVYRMACNTAKQFADNKYIATVCNFIESYEQQIVKFKYPSIAQRNDSIPLQLTFTNGNNLTVDAYYVPFEQKIPNDLSKWQFKKVRSAHYTINMPETGKDTTVTRMFAPLDYGRYVFRISCNETKTDTLIRIQRKYNFPTIIITGLHIFESTVGHETRVYVVDPSNGKPVEDATIHIGSPNGNTLKTNSDGYVVVTGKSYRSNVYATKGKDRSKDISLYTSYSTNDLNRTHREAHIVTDLGVYRPGETARFAAIVFDRWQLSSKPVNNVTFNAILENNYATKLDTLTLRTDAFGRLAGAFVVPDNGITGRYTIWLTEAHSGKTISQGYFTVSEYKAPSFYLEYDAENSTLAASDTIVLCGKAVTYSQFPLADISISYSISPVNYFLRPTGPALLITGQTCTDSEGTWRIVLPANSLTKDGYSRFALNLTGTSETGESQSCHVASIGVGSKTFIDFDNDKTTFDVSDDKFCVPFSLKDVSDTPIDGQCRYGLITENDTVAGGIISTTNPVIDCSDIPSGRYTLHLGLIGDSTSTNDTEVILYRKRDKEPPYTALLWSPVEQIQCQADGSFELPIGTSYDNYVFYTIYSDTRIISEGRAKWDKGNRTFKGHAEFDKDVTTHIEFLALRNFKSATLKVDLLPAQPQDSVKIVLETFRDNITPNSHETWKLRLVGNNGKRYVGAFIANMYDASLNAIVDNSYSFTIYRYIPDIIERNLSAARDNTDQLAAPLKLTTVKAIRLPQLNLYGRSISYGYSGWYGMTRNTVAMPRYAMAKTDAYDEVYIEAGVPEAEFMDSGKGAAGTGDTPVEVRQNDIHSAFFMPALVTDSLGCVTLTFDVPNANTQWQFSAIAYTADMKYDVINRKVTASKQIMVNANTPRFVRTGDTVTVISSVMNKQDCSDTVAVTVDILDPATGNVLLSDTQTINLAPRSSQAVPITFTVDDKLQHVAHRIIARGRSASDGEQNLLAVLPATSRVIEAEPFYLKDGTEKASLSIPDFGHDGKITFEYCDNPVWYCVTALPSIISDAQTSSAIVRNYYAAAVADHIAKNYPHIAEALRTSLGNDSLQSAISRNAELKVLDLTATPWVRNADNETSRLANVARLADPADISYRLQKTATQLADLQAVDGAFRWFNKDKPSLFITYDVLNVFGMLKIAGAMPDNPLTESIIRLAVDYCDNEMLKTLRKQGKNDKTNFWQYHLFAYTRSLHQDIAMPDSIRSLIKLTADSAAAQWGRFSLADKVDAAILLKMNGRDKAAKSIIESLRQYARKSDRYGMYWDVRGDQLSLATSALTAFALVDPKDHDIDNIRRWILMQKETLDWKSTMTACRAVSALLTSGTDWTADSKATQIEFGGNPVDTDKSSSPYLGYVKRTVTSDMLNGDTIVIRRSGNGPAWGAVYCTYDAPMAEIEKQSSPDIRIDKQFFRYTADGRIEQVPLTELAVGDRIQVRITVHSARDLDYVALTDERPACFEPVNQLPVYKSIDGVFCYLETRDASTNLFAARLSKGDFVLTYDVFVNNSGTYSSGIATLQCQYAPQIVSHSSGTTISVK